MKYKNEMNLFEAFLNGIYEERDELIEQSEKIKIDSRFNERKIKSLKDELKNEKANVERLKMVKEKLMQDVKIEKIQKERLKEELDVLKSKGGSKQ